MYHMKTIQKQMKICLSAILLLLMMAVTCNTVSAAGTKSLKLNKKKATITEGKTLKLKAAVKPKKAKVTWSSNKKKVATVSKKGVVKAKKKGKATITAKSGKKKATCKVTVKAKKTPTRYSLASVSVTDSKVIRVTLNRAKALTKTDFVVKTKSEGKGAYNKTLNIESVQNSGNKVYDIILSTSDNVGVINGYDTSDVNEINNLDYVFVTCAKLNGIKTKEAIYNGANNPTNVYVEGTIGATISESVSFDSWLKGYCTYTISKLPAGIKATKGKNSVSLRGVPTAVSKGTKVTITAKDEMGKIVTRNVYFYIGNVNTLVTYTSTENKTVLRGDNSSENISIYTAGGTGDYTLTLNNSNPYVSINNSSSISIDDKIPVGTHAIKYTVTDSNKKAASGTVKVTVENAVRVTGNVRAMDNEGISGAGIDMIFEDKANKYYDNIYYTYSSGTNGEYSLYVPASKQYKIGIYKNGTSQYQYNVNVGNITKMLNFKLPLYRITLIASNKERLEDVDWYFIDNTYHGNDMYLGAGSLLYLKKGTYTIEGSKGLYKYTANITVKGNASVTVKAVSIVKSTLKLNQEQTISLMDGEYYYVQFKPTQSGIYEFSGTSSNNYLQMSLYETDINDGSIDYESGWTDDSEPLLLSGNWLQSGKTYYIRFYTDEGNAVSKIKVTKKSMEELSVGNTKNISLDSEEYTWLSFTPSTSGNYNITTSEVGTYVYAYLYNDKDLDNDIDYASNGFDDEEDEEPISLSMNNVSLNAGQVYFIKIRAYSFVDMGITITPTQTE